MNKIIIKVDTSEIEKATEKVKELNVELKKLKEIKEGLNGTSIKTM